MEPSSPIATVPVLLSRRRDAGARTVLVTLAPDPALAAAYVAPGQYLYVDLGAERSGHFVLAGDVGAPTWELLVRNAGSAAEAIMTAPEGSVVAVAGPLGQPSTSGRGRSTTCRSGRRSPAGRPPAPRTSSASSRPGGGDDVAPFANASVAEGWVQHVLERDLAAGRLAHGLVFAAGPAAMLDALQKQAAPVDVVARTPMLEVVTNL